MADALTANYGWTKPNVGDQAGIDLWGGKINADLDAIDAQVFTNAQGIAAIPSQGVTGGFVNKLRNGTFDIWQRGATITVIGAAATTADGWLVAVGGASMAVAISAPNSAGRSLNGMAMFGATGITGTTVVTKIESVISAQLPAAIALTFQIKVYNGTGATITPTLGVYHASARDDFSAPVTDLAPVSLQPCANNVYQICAYTFTLPVASLQSGIQFNLIFGGVMNASGKNVVIAEADFRATPGMPLGLNANPPPPELRPIHEEMAFCQRYFVRPNIALPLAGYASAAGQVVYMYWTAPVSLRAASTITAVWGSGINAVAGTIGLSADFRTLQSNISAATAGAYSAILTITSLSAEL